MEGDPKIDISWSKVVRYLGTWVILHWNPVFQSNKHQEGKFDTFNKQVAKVQCATPPNKNVSIFKY